MKLKLSLTAIAGLLLLTLMGCASNPKPVTLPPGALNQADATMYESLMGAQAVLESVKADIAKLPPEAKPALNKAIASYNVAENAWKIYHASGAGDATAVQTAITKAVSDVTALLVATTGGH